MPAGFRLLFRFLPVGFASEIQSLHRFFQAGFQVFLIHWLQQIILAAKLHGFAKKAVFRVAGKHNADHGILAETCIFHGPFHQVKAVFPWHFNVADQNIDRILFQEFLFQFSIFQIPEHAHSFGVSSATSPDSLQIFLQIFQIHSFQSCLFL